MTKACYQNCNHRVSYHSINQAVMFIYKDTHALRNCLLALGIVWFFQVLTGALHLHMVTTCLSYHMYNHHPVTQHFPPVENSLNFKL